MARDGLPMVLAGVLGTATMATGCYAQHMQKMQRIELAPIASSDLDCPEEQLLFERLNTGLETGWRVTGCERAEGYLEAEEGWKRSDGSAAAVADPSVPSGE